MAKFVIEGGHKLSGEVKVSGSKNAVLPILAATLLSRETSEIENVPDIVDIHHLITILKDMGAEVSWEEGRLTINPEHVSLEGLNPRIFKKFRGSVVLVGPMLARFGKALIPQPGGCIIGVRPIDTHIHALEDLGSKVTFDGECYNFETDGLIGGKVVLDEMSVTGTENAIMAATCAAGISFIHLSAVEPEILNLIDFLQYMGAKISWQGSHTLMIEGVANLRGGKVRVIPDRIEAGTWAIAAAITRGEVLIKDFPVADSQFLLKKLKEVGVRFEAGEDWLRIKQSSNLRATNVKTAVYPGFPTDLQAPFTVLLTQAAGTSIMFETLFDGRLNYAQELAKMGANITALDPHRLQITGPTALKGKEIESFDLRAGATLILAALSAEGTSVIDKVELVDRGYEHIEKKLKELGAVIERVEE
jgi:UDP-N-acetylglucosamine 1-carboxyvinyltransferase